MPRERVKHGKIWAYKKHEGSSETPAGVSIKEYFPGADTGDYDYLREDPNLEVNWSKEYGHVQVSIGFPREQWLELAKELEDDPSIIAKAIYTTELTRPEINEMIRVLRRARDQAYGRDE